MCAPFTAAFSGAWATPIKEQRVILVDRSPLHRVTLLFIYTPRFIYVI